MVAQSIREFVSKMFASMRLTPCCSNKMIIAECRATERKLESSGHIPLVCAVRHDLDYAVAITQNLYH